MSEVLRMDEWEYARGGYIPGPPVSMRMLVREDGWASFDGPSGPWFNIIAPSQIATDAKEALKALKDAGDE